MTEKAPTLDDIGISGDVQKILEASAQEIITEPEERWSKKSTMVRYGKKELPERVTVYRRLTGRAAEVPTATVGRTLQKIAPDGGPVFVRTLAQCAVTPPPFIDRVCEVCAEVYGKPKRFYKEANYRGHMRGFHTLEWEEIQRQEERDERRLDRELLAQALTEGRERASGSTEKSQKSRTGSAGQEVTRGDARRDYLCEVCGFGSVSAFGLRAHKKVHLPQLRRE
jgi:hypothetical protein